MAALRDGDVVRNQTRLGPQPFSLRTHCPACRCYLTREATSCRRCGTRFETVTDGYAQVISLGRL